MPPKRMLSGPSQAPYKGCAECGKPGDGLGLRVVNSVGIRSASMCAVSVV